MLEWEDEWGQNGGRVGREQKKGCCRPLCVIVTRVYLCMVYIRAFIPIFTYTC